jgi:hypothetical protein
LRSVVTCVTSRPILQQDASTGPLDPKRQFQVFADGVADGGVTSDRLIGLPANQHELPAGCNGVAVRRLYGLKILVERHQKQPAGYDEPLGKTAQALARRQRQQRQLLRARRGNRAADRLATCHNVCVDETKPFIIRT